MFRFGNGYPAGIVVPGLSFQYSLPLSLFAAGERQNRKGERKRRCRACVFFVLDATSRESTAVAPARPHMNDGEKNEPGNQNTKISLFSVGPMLPHMFTQEYNVHGAPVDVYYSTTKGRVNYYTLGKSFSEAQDVITRVCCLMQHTSEAHDG